MRTQAIIHPHDSPRACSTRWYSAHIYYHDPDKDALLLDAIRPLFHQLRPLVERAYVVRHWRQGPHLRLHLRTDPHTWTSTIQPQLEQTITRYLRAHPSPITLDERAELPLHLLLAERENEHGPLTPWFPNNSLHYQPHDPRLHVLGHPELAELLTDYLTDSTELLFAMLEHVHDGADTKELLSLTLMLTTSHTVSPPLIHSFVAYRAHAEGFLFQSSDPPATRAAFEQHYHTHRHTLIDRVHAVIATLTDHHTQPIPFARPWATLIHTYADRAMPLIRQGRVFFPTPIPQPHDPPRPALQQLMFNSHAYRKRVLDNPDFHRYRFALNCTYLHLNRLGLAPPHRMRACHLAANAVEDAYGVSAFDMITTLVQQSS